MQDNETVPGKSHENHCLLQQYKNKHNKTENVFPSLKY